MPSEIGLIMGISPEGFGRTTLPPLLLEFLELLRESLAFEAFLSVAPDMVEFAIISSTSTWQPAKVDRSETDKSTYGVARRCFIVLSSNAQRITPPFRYPQFGTVRCADLRSFL